MAVTNRKDGELPPERQVRSRGLLAVSLLGRSQPGAAARFAAAQLARGGYGGCNLLVANPNAAFVVHAPGVRNIWVVRLGPGTHAMTNLDLDDVADPRIKRVRAELEPKDFVVSAERLCRDDEIVVSGVERGTVSSSLVLAGRAVVLYHILGDPRQHHYQEYCLL